MNSFSYQIYRDEIDYLAGKQACRKGEPCPESATQAFIAGYGKQYAEEAQLTHKSIEQENHYGSYRN